MLRRFLTLTCLGALVLCSEAFAAKKTVTVGAYIHDIQRLDLKTHSYNLDIYIWMKWKESQFDPARSMELLNPTELWGHVRSYEFEKPDKLPSGEYYQVIRDTGLFSKKFDLSNYPFDKQVLVLDFEDNDLHSDELEYVLDENPITMNPSMKLPGFTLQKPFIEVLNSKYPTTFGDPRATANYTFSKVRISVPITRPKLTYSVKLLLPIICVILCAALMFLFKPSYVDSRVGIGITALLTIVALQITLNEDLPDCDYLVLIDKIYLGAYLYVIFGLAVIVQTTWWLDKGNIAKAVWLNRLSLFVLTALYLATMCYLISSSIGGGSS